MIPLKAPKPARDGKIAWRAFALLFAVAIAWVVVSHWLIATAGVARGSRAWHVLHAAAGTMILPMITLSLPWTLPGEPLRPLAWRVRMVAVIMVVQFCLTYWINRVPQ